MARTNSRGGLMGLAIRLVINAVALWLAAQVVPGIAFERADDFQAIILVALIFGVVNALIRPLTLVLTCLINVLTLGLFTLVVNAAMLWLTSELALRVGLGFHVQDFVAAFLGALVISIVSMILTRIFD